MTLELIFPGKPMSGNHSQPPLRGGRTPKGAPRFRNVRTAEARKADERIERIALAATLSARWKMPDYVRCDVWICNIRMDRDNVLKELNDPLQGIVFHHDSRILDGRTIKLKDKRGPRVILHISPIDGRRYGYRPPAKVRP
jgi:Holliday junction resolvase RusA-like endonuclease